MKESAGREREGTQQAVKSYRGPCQCSSPSLHPIPTKGSKRPAFLAPTDGESEPALACSPRRQQAGGAAQTCSSRKRGATDAWAHLFVPPASFPLAPVPPAMGGSGLTGSRWAEMAAVVRGARAGRGGHGRDQGRRRGPADDQEPVPQVNEHVAMFWTHTIENLKDDEESVRFYQFLEKSPLVDPMELVKFGISDGLAAQPEGIVRKLRSVLDVLNNMMPVRQSYLYQYIHGERGGELPKMEKRFRKSVLLADEKIQEIRDANAYCPARPKLFDSNPRPLIKK